MHGVSRSAFFALLPALINAVSLSDMTPRAQNLPDDCERVYDSQISGCGIPDFTTSACSDTCVKALQAMVGPIQEACGGQGVVGQNLVVAFLADVGPQQICPNAEMGSGGSSSVESTPSPSPSPTSTSMTTPSETMQSSTVQSTSLLVDTSSGLPTRTRTQTPAFSGTTTAGTLTQSRSFAPTTSADGPSSRTTDAAGATSSSDAEPERAQQAAQDESGGGSPFDDEGNMFSGADSLSSTSVLVSLGIAVVVVVFLFR